MRYTIGHKVAVKEGSVFAETFDAAGLEGEIVDFDEEEEFDYKILLDGETYPLLINDNELI